MSNIYSHHQADHKSKQNMFTFAALNIFSAVNLFFLFSQSAWWLLYISQNM